MDKQGSARGSTSRRIQKVELVAARMGISPAVLRLLEERGVLKSGKAATARQRTRLRLLAEVLVMGIPERDSVRLIWGPAQGHSLVLR